MAECKEKTSQSGTELSVEALVAESCGGKQSEGGETCYCCLPDDTNDNRRDGRAENLQI